MRVIRKFLFFTLILPLVVEAQDQKIPGFVISGSVKGVLEKSRVYLTNLNNPGDTVARGQVMEGRFRMTGRIPEPNLYELNFASAKKKIPLFIGNENIRVEGSIENLLAIRISGSPSQDDFTEFQHLFNPYFTRINMLVQLSNSPAGLSKSDSISRLMTEVIASVESAVDQFIQNKKTSYVSPFILLVVSQLSADVFLLEKRFNSLSVEMQGGYYGKILKEQIENGKIGAVGTEEIDFTQNDTTGHPITLSSYKGKYVLVDFWASWCHPCRMENPNVVATYARFKDKNFTILGVSLDRTREPWIKAIADDNLSWAQVSDLKFWSNEVALKYRVQSIPQNYLIDPTGKIIGKNLRGPEFESKLCEVLGCN
jgi:peroxiredoxin